MREFFYFIFFGNKCECCGTDEDFMMRKKERNRVTISLCSRTPWSTPSRRCTVRLRSSVQHDSVLVSCQRWAPEICLWAERPLKPTFQPERCHPWRTPSTGLLAVRIRRNATAFGEGIINVFSISKKERWGEWFHCFYLFLSSRRLAN